MLYLNEEILCNNSGLSLREILDFAEDVGIKKGLLIKGMLFQQRLKGNSFSYTHGG